MSGKQFFIDRYKRLGWQYRKPKLKQAVRINSSNIEPAVVLDRLQRRGLRLEKIPFLENGYWVEKSDFSVGATSEYLLGLYSIQEAAAQIPVSLFTDLKNKKVLDVCAAPGGKTTQLADSMSNTGAIVALDVDRRRLIALTNHLERCRSRNAVVYDLDAREVNRLNLKFDRVLCDMPCSGNFVTDEEWFQRRTIEDVTRNARLQREILASAVKVLNDDGEIVYSTCSLEPEENELNIDWAIRNLHVKVVKINAYGQKGVVSVFGQSLDSSIVNCRRIWPDQTQGFFVCKLRKGESA
jgi:NOL1/NOP2/sun family putative RNA methylase